jgi:hypothetical protein
LDHAANLIVSAYAVKGCCLSFPAIPFFVVLLALAYAGEIPSVPISFFMLNLHNPFPWPGTRRGRKTVPTLEGYSSQTRETFGVMAIP